MAVEIFLKHYERRSNNKHTTSSQIIFGKRETIQTKEN